MKEGAWTRSGRPPAGRQRAGSAAGREAAGREAAGRMAAAAAAWLDALDPAQRAVATSGAPSADAESDAERRRWFYTPTDHGGLTLGAQRPAQQRLALRLVASGLSVAGYVTVATIVGLDNVLDQVEGWSVDWGRERGRDPGLYYLRVFGEPGGTAPWGWRFGGHHVSLNNLVVDGVVRADDPVLLRRRPGGLPAARARAAAPAGRGRGPGPRAGPLAGSGPGRPGDPAGPGAVGHRRRQQVGAVRRRPARSTCATYGAASSPIRGCWTG